MMNFQAKQWLFVNKEVFSWSLQHCLRTPASWYSITETLLLQWEQRHGLVTGLKQCNTLLMTVPSLTGHSLLPAVATWASLLEGMQPPAGSWWVFQQSQGKRMNHCITLLSAHGDPVLHCLHFWKETLREWHLVLVSTCPIPMQKVKSPADQQVHNVLCDVVAQLMELQCFLTG